MADDEGSRRSSQAYATVSPAGVGTTTNRVSPSTLQEILDSWDQPLIDQTLDQFTANVLTAYLQSLPSPPGVGGAAVSPTGTGSQASRTPSTGGQTPHSRSPFFLQEHALRTGVVPDFPVEDREEPVPHVDVLDEDEDEDEDEAIHGDLNPPPRYHGRPLDLPNKSRHEGHLETLNQADLQR